MHSTYSRLADEKPELDLIATDLAKKSGTFQFLNLCYAFTMAPSLFIRVLTQEISTFLSYRSYPVFGQSIGRFVSFTMDEA